MNKIMALSLCGIMLSQTACTGENTSNTSYSATSYEAGTDNSSIDETALNTANSIQQQNNIDALNASMAAAEQQNQEAQQQTLQTELNARPVDNSNQ